MGEGCTWCRGTLEEKHLVLPGEGTRAERYSGKKKKKAADKRTIQLKKRPRLEIARCVQRTNPKLSKAFWVVCVSQGAAGDDVR